MIDKIFTSKVCFTVFLIATAGDLVVPFFIARFSEYNHLTMVMSVLGNHNRPMSWLYNLWLIVAGVVFLISAITWYKMYSRISVPLAAWLSIAIAIYAVGGCVLSGIFPVGETKELATIPAKIHGIGSSIGFMVFISCPLVIALLSFRRHKTSVGVISLLFFVAAIVFFAFFIMSDKEQFDGTVISLEGLWRRLSLLCMYAPLMIVSLSRLFQKIPE